MSNQKGSAENLIGVNYFERLVGNHATNKSMSEGFSCCL